MRPDEEVSARAVSLAKAKAREAWSAVVLEIFDPIYLRLRGSKDHRPSSSRVGGCAASGMSVR
jgi:hypothetical protein